jgi:hypothetical protein
MHPSLGKSLRTSLPSFLEGSSLLTITIQGLLKRLTSLGAERVRLVSKAGKFDLHRHDSTVKLFEGIRL